MNLRVKSFENRCKLGYNLLPGLVKNKHFTYVGALWDLAQRALLPNAVVLLDKPLPNNTVLNRPFLFVCLECLYHFLLSLCLGLDWYSQQMKSVWEVLTCLCYYNVVIRQLTVRVTYFSLQGLNCYFKAKLKLQGCTVTYNKHYWMSFLWYYLE